MTSTYQSCSHSGTVHVATRGNIMLFGGGTSKSVSSNGMDFVLDLVGNYSPTFWTFPDGWRVKEYLVPPKVIKMPITDMHAPWEVGLPFWRKLWADLQEQAHGHRGATGERLKILVLCMGGHGRTGTVLSALLRASKLRVPDGDIVTYIRSRYCSKAVESADQIDYLRSLGIYVPVSASKSSTTTYYPNQTSSWKPPTLTNSSIGGNHTQTNPSTFQPTQKGGDEASVQTLPLLPAPTTPKSDPTSRFKGPGGMRGNDGNWYTSSVILTMADDLYTKLFVDAEDWPVGH